MPSPKIVIEPGCIYHLIPRFTAREFFIESDRQRDHYRRLLGAYIAESDWKCFAYALMSNHVHLGVVAGEMPLADWMRDMHREFAEAINVQRDRIGQVFVRGPRKIKYSEAEMSRLVGYIHRNPVRAGVVREPKESDWTSHQAYLRLARRPSWLDVELGLERIGLTPRDFDLLASMPIWDRREPEKPRGRPKKKLAG
jgi:REP element-mobilizing transposase RayT